MRGFRIVAGYLLAIMAVVALQFIPYVGIILMVMLAMAWAAVLFNVMLLHLAIAALCRRIGLAWLALPAVIYGGWGMVAAMDYAQASRFRAELEAGASAVARTEPAPREVVVAAPEASQGQADSMAASLIKLVDSVRVFANGREFFLLPIADPRCKMMPNAQMRTFGATQARQRSKEPLREPYDRCVIATPATTPDTALVLAPETIGRAYGSDSHLKKINDDRTTRVYVEVLNLAPLDLERLRFARRTIVKRPGAGGALVEAGAVVQGKIEYLSPIPFFAAGCGLNSGNPSWDCFFTLWRQQMDVGRAEGFHWMMPGDAYYLAEKVGLPLRE
jgi:hypothetical protein